MHQIDEGMIPALTAALWFMEHTGLPLMQDNRGKHSDEYALWVFPEVGKWIAQSGLVEEELYENEEGYVEYRLNRVGKALAQQLNIGLRAEKEE